MFALNPMLDDLVRQVGPRPFFAYDLDALAAHADSLQGGAARLWYACKANPLSRVLGVLAESGWCFDVASPGELGQVLAIGVPPERILVTGPAKTRAFLQQCVAQGVRRFVLESHNQLRWLEEVAAGLGEPVHGLLRLQLSWDEGTENPLGGAKASPFGMSPTDWQQDWPARLKWVTVDGAHAFQWGQMLDVNRLAAIWRHIAESAQRLFRDLGLSLHILDLGGGLGIPYQEGQMPLTWSAVNAALQRIAADFAVPALWLEPGRYAVGPFGYYLAPVVDRKPHPQGDWLVLAGGIHHLARPALTGTSFPCRHLTRRDASTARFQLAGPLCTALDRLGTAQLPATTGPGDWLVFGQTGAYGFTESMPFFLCHDLPGEAVVRNGRAEWVRYPALPTGWLR